MAATSKSGEDPSLSYKHRSPFRFELIHSPSPTDPLHSSSTNRPLPSPQIQAHWDESFSPIPITQKLVSISSRSVLIDLNWIKFLSLMETQSKIGSIVFNSLHQWIYSSLFFFLIFLQQKSRKNHSISSSSMPGETIDIAKVIVKQESPQDNTKRGTKSKVTKLSKSVKRGL